MCRPICFAEDGVFDLTVYKYSSNGVAFSLKGQQLAERNSNMINIVGYLEGLAEAYLSPSTSAVETSLDHRWTIHI